MFMNTIKFNEGIAKLDFDTLKRTAGYEMAKGGLPKNRPLEHHQLIDMLADKANSIKNSSVSIDPIYCTEKQALRVMWAGNKDECPVENHLIQRLTTRIQIKSKSDKEMNMAIGLSYNEKGITIAFGANIWICSNQNVFGENLMSTYTAGRKEKMPFEKIMDVFNAWMTNFEAKKESDYKKIELMNNTIVERKELKLLYGELIESAVLSNLEGSYNAPMNQTQVAEFIRQAHSEKYEVPVGEEIKLWDLNQMGTEVLKPHYNDFTTSYQVLNNFNNFLLDKYCTV